MPRVLRTGKEYGMDEKSPLAESLRFNPRWWVDPIGPWLYDLLEKDAVTQVARIQLEFVRDTLARQAEAVGQVIEVLGR
jgi:hypothetical protein